MNATSSKIIRTIAILVIIFVIIGLGAWYVVEYGFNGSNGFRGLSFSTTGRHRIEALTGSYEERERYEEEIDGIKQIQVYWITSAVDFKVYDDDSILLIESCQRELTEGENLAYTIENGILKIRELEDESKLWIAPKKVVIYIPENLLESLEVLKSDCSLTDITAQDITADTIYLESDTGRIDVRNLTASQTITLDTDTASITASNIKAKNIVIDSDTGSIEVNRAVADTKADIETDTGRVEVNDITTPTLYCDSDTGRVTCTNYTVDSITQSSDTGAVETEGTFKTGDFRSNTGSVTMKCATLPESIYAKSDTGSIHLYIARNDNLVVSYKTGTGDFTSEFPVLVSSSGDAAITLKTATGNIYIKPYEAE
ncbi:MAG TPA: DUF4097 family beta strand repeat-containing protein [Clostridia bacterium]|nr:MAG: hypothetical protein BWX97_01597 [Firmicutes bacterium ADurb.Bin146]HOD92769.1 DUF4097 family beta strand repeat-containing protein [Clostridia bacterium]HQM39539.1 DUF4097 family beta strand repeat-containing protein [Clostridia bacterium]